LDVSVKPVENQSWDDSFISQNASKNGERGCAVSGPGADLGRSVVRCGIGRTEVPGVYLGRGVVVRRCVLPDEAVLCSTGWPCLGGGLMDFLIRWLAPQRNQISTVKGMHQDQNLAKRKGHAG
jgi:hypothetical protein